MDSIKPDFVSKTHFFLFYQDNFKILNDQKTLIGAEKEYFNEYSEIVIEDITNTDPEYVPVKFPTNNSKIFTILIDEERKCLFIGNENEVVIEYSLDTQGYSINFIKKYEDLGIGSVHSSLKFGNIAVFGGDCGTIAFIDIENKQHLGNISDLAVGRIFSIQLCKVQNGEFDTKLLLTLTGDEYDYSGSKTDVLDITEFIKSGQENQQ